MRHLISIGLLLHYFAAVCQPNSRAFVYVRSLDSVNIKIPAKSIEFNSSNLPVLEITYGRNDAKTGNIILDTAFYQSKKYYHYEHDTLLKMIIDCQAINSERLFADYWNAGNHITYDIPAVNTKDTIVTYFAYDSLGLLQKKWHSKAVQTYVYGEAGQTISDTIYGNAWENEEFSADTSVATYLYFEGGYIIKRMFNDNASSRIDSFVHIDQQWQKHCEELRKYSDLPCERGMTIRRTVYSTKTNYTPDGRTLSKEYRDEYGSEWAEEYVYDKQ